MSTPAVPPRYEENRAHARRFAEAWAGERRERAEKDTFWNEFLAVFGVERRQVARFEPVAQRYSTGRHGFIDVFWPGRLLVEHKAAGKDLDQAMEQAKDYLPGMAAEDVPPVLVACDFSEFVVHDLDTGTDERFPLSELPNKLEVFGLLDGRDRRRYDSDEDVNLAATELLAGFHDALREMGYPDHHRRVLLTRVLFCLFADDAGVWPMGLFEDFLRLRTRPDGSDLGPQLAQLFQVLDTAPAQRSPHLPDELRDFTYINGGLFEETLRISDCDAAMRDALLRCSRFNWSVISPAIFGSMFQHVMAPAERRVLGAHYTSEVNILRTIRPLFLDGLEQELDRADSVPKLRAFRDRLAELTFFDPACGCGNFLVIAYREIRRLETQCLIKLRETEARIAANRGGGARRGRSAAGAGQLAVDVTLESKVGVGQFYGIEVEEFPCRIAETAMHLTDHLANRDLSSALGIYYARFPIGDTAVIHHGNAVSTDWEDVIPAADCSYVLGNPPFVGMAWMSASQQQDRTSAFAALRYPGTRTGRLDYVAAWYAKAVTYLDASPSPQVAFVSTNSITQGEQARTLGPLMRAHGIHIDFAHRTFDWTSEARGAAHVHVVIIGFSAGQRGECRLFDYPDIKGEPIEHKAKTINIYLADAPEIVPPKRDRPLIAALPEASKGSQPTDGGNLIVGPEDHAEILADPIAAKYLRPYRQSREMLHGKDRWCLWLTEATPADLRGSTVLKTRLQGVRDARLKSPTASVRDRADTPSLFTQVRQPVGDYVAMPEASSGNRRYIPAMLYGPDTIAGNKLICWPGADLWLFGVLSSRCYTLWVGTVAGKIKSDYSMAPDLAWCTFPTPDPDGPSRSKITKAARGVLDARADHPGATLAELYDPIAMPPSLVRAHRDLDRAVENGVAAGRRFATDGDRLSALFQRYQDMTA
ncbi:hypothetical protein ND486_25560 [Pseudonocardia sp. DR1-2]|uniref:class I SAM-dependent DNA methyltransferase n=1 Tax=Pseudonocardia sp. DR1-2 TaxID=2951168 RepID=UPI0020436B18|nr:DNA methyltransferase [Pseudonocardia sp. DR1-2]MCM3849567.1 hypothetical protein [Pseudonocardia sp. DR1-2]